MGVFFRKTKYFILFLCLSLFIFNSCETKKKIRIDISESIQYKETPQYYDVQKVNTLTSFKYLQLHDKENITSLLKNKHNFIWLKIDFTIPEELQNKNLGLYIAELKTADRVWINNIPCGSYGKFPPNELSAGFGAQHFTFNKSVLNRTGTNTIYIQTWTGCPFSVPNEMFIGTEFDAFQKAERRTFFTSKIILCFACISFLASFIYLLLYFFLKKFSKSKTYLYYSILMFFSVITLIPFCLYEIPWLKPQYLSYFTIMKILISLGIFSTILFVNIFIVSFLEQKENIFIKISRIILYIIPVTAALLINNYEKIPIFTKYFFPIIFTQFLFTTYQAIKAFGNKKTRQLTIFILLSVIPAIIGFIIDLITNKYVNIEIHPPYASIYGWQITSYIFISYLLRSFAKVYVKNTKLKNDMVMFNAKLENEVEIRTKELSEKNFILSRGLEAITLVQQEILPKKNKTFMGWDIAVQYIPLDNEVSGDLYDYYFTNNSKLDGLSIIDISGHGIPAGLMTILAKGIINQQYLNGIATECSMTEILEAVNTTYINEKVNVENYFTGLLFNFGNFSKSDKCKIQVANAGHPAPLLYTEKTDTVTEIKYENQELQYGFIGVDGLPISFPTTEFSMCQNDILVCFTDGLTEAMNTSKEEFSKTRVANILAGCKDLTAEEISNTIMNELKEFMGENKLSDDLTLIVLKRTDSKDYLEEI